MNWNGLAQAYQYSESEQAGACITCGVEFASPAIAQRRRDGKTFYCPNGHAQHFTKTTEQQLREQLEAAQRDRDWQRSQRQTSERRLQAQRAQTTIARNKLRRVHAGVCPECHRSFPKLAAHMASKHPTLVESK